MYVPYVHLLCISQSLREAAALGVRSVSLSPAGIGDQLTAPRRRREGSRRASTPSLTAATGALSSPDAGRRATRTDDMGGSYSSDD